MKKENSKTRYIALLCSFIIVFSIVLTGCGSVKKITQKKSANSSDEIQIGTNSDVLEGPTQIVVSDDGQSYIVDNNGHSVVYNPSQSGGSYTASNITPSNTTPRVRNRPQPKREHRSRQRHRRVRFIMHLRRRESSVSTVLTTGAQSSLISIFQQSEFTLLIMIRIGLLSFGRANMPWLRSAVR